MSVVLRQALIAQALAFAFVAVMVPLVPWPPAGPPILLLAALQGGLAAAIAWRRGAPSWWLLIHLVFLPLAALARELHLPPWIWLLGFLALLLVFWRTDRSRVPLYLSNEATAETVAALLPSAPCALIDLGCGDGHLLQRLARLRPDCRFVGIEHAPLPWLIARLRCATLPNVHIRIGSFWKESLSGYDVAYAFLSPAPMPALGAKALAECRPGSLLISNSFPCHSTAPERIVTVGDRRATRLYCYRPGN